MTATHRKIYNETPTISIALSGNRFFRPHGGEQSTFKFLGIRRCQPKGTSENPCFVPSLWVVSTQAIVPQLP